MLHIGKLKYKSNINVDKIGMAAYISGANKTSLYK